TDAFIPENKLLHAEASSARRQLGQPDYWLLLSSRSQPRPLGTQLKKQPRSRTLFPVAGRYSDSMSTTIRSPIIRRYLSLSSILRRVIRLRSATLTVWSSIP